MRLGPPKRARFRRGPTVQCPAGRPAGRRFCEDGHFLCCEEVPRLGLCIRPAKVMSLGCAKGGPEAFLSGCSGFDGQLSATGRAPVQRLRSGRVKMSLRTVFGVLLFVAGCCRGTGTAHKCDFTPPDVPGVRRRRRRSDTVRNGDLRGGQGLLCHEIARGHLLRRPRELRAVGREDIEIPCFKPTDCPDSRLTCCASMLDGNASVSCRPTIACLGANTDVACSTDADCPLHQPDVHQLTASHPTESRSTSARRPRSPPAP